MELSSLDEPPYYLLGVRNVSHCVCCPLKNIFLRVKLDPNKREVSRLNGRNVLKLIFVKVI